MSDIISIVLYVDEDPANPPSLSIIVNSQLYSLQSPTFSNGKLVWNVNSLCDFDEEAPNCNQFLLNNGSQVDKYLLNQLVYLGPTKSAKPPHNVYLIELISGIYIRKNDYKNTNVTFTVDSMFTLDSKNIELIQTNLKKLQEEQEKFEDKKRKLGIDFNQLQNLKAQYEESLREKRKLQYEFSQKTSSVIAEEEHARLEYNTTNQIQKLEEHIQANQSKCREIHSQTSPESYSKLLRFRLDALNELKSIFPFNENEKRICSVVYNENPTTEAQGNELKAFLGFATHYIHEVSRIVGVPLKYILSPRAGLSTITDRESNKQWSISIQFTDQNYIKTLREYEAILVQCALNITESLMMSTADNSNIPLLAYLSKLNSIGQAELETLNPI